MAYFPDDVMPKRLKRETAAEVDNSPLIMNARDYNIHEREIRAIEQMLIGNRRNSLAVSDPEDPAPTTSLLDLVNLAIDIFRRMSDGGMITNHSGVLQAGGTVPLPGGSVHSVTSGTVLAAAGTVTVQSTDGFPNAGYITKFNSIDSATLCSGGNGHLAQCPVGSLQYQGFEFGKTMTNQELIQYTGRTATTFTGCTRGVGGSTAQDATDGAPAIVMCGAASIMFSHNLWDVPTGSPVEVYLEHNAMLRTNAAVMQEGSRKVIKSIGGLVEVAYSMVVSGWFDDVDVSQIFNLVE